MAQLPTGTPQPPAGKYTSALNKSTSSVTNFLSHITRNGGMSTSNNFIVEVVNYFAPTIGDSYESNADLNTGLLFLCDEAQLPNINTASGTQNGVLTGIGSVDYPHTKIYTEIQLTFMLDANLSLLKFFNEWYSRIFSDDNASIHADPDKISPKNRATRLNYRSTYASDMRITKTEVGPLSADQRKPVTYVLENAWPYSIDAVPLQFGSSQITKLTVNFKYERHQIVHRNIRGITNITKGELVKHSRIDPDGNKKNRLVDKIKDAQEFTGRQDLINANSNIG